MALRRFVAVSVAAVLAAPMGLMPASAAPPVPVSHDAVDCLVAGESPLVEASAPAGANVATARTYFKSASSDWYYVEGTVRGAGRYVFTLPQPRIEASPVSYYVQFLPDGRTPEYMATVVEKSSECKGRIAAISPTGAGAVYAPGGAIVSPAGFGVAAAAIATGVGVAAASAGVSTGLLVAGGVAAAGAVATAVVVTTDEVGSPSPEPTRPPTTTLPPPPPPPPSTTQPPAPEPSPASATR